MPKSYLFELLIYAVTLLFRVLEIFLSITFYVTNTLLHKMPMLIGFIGGVGAVLVTIKLCYYTDATYKCLVIDFLDHIILLGDNLLGYKPPLPPQTVTSPGLTVLSKRGIWVVALGSVSIICLYTISLSVACNKIFLLHLLPFLIERNTNKNIIPIESDDNYYNQAFTSLCKIKAF